MVTVRHWTSFPLFAGAMPHNLNHREQHENGFRDYFGTRLSIPIHKGAIFTLCSSLTDLATAYKSKQINGSGYSAAW